MSLCQLPRIFLGILALSSAGCASLYEMKLPSKGGPLWLTLQSPHFVVQTDLSDLEARAFVTQLELRRSALIAGAWHDAKFKLAVTRVVAFRDTDEIGEFLPNGVLGLWTVDFSGDKQMLVARRAGARPLTVSFLGVPVGTIRFDGLEVATHELSHELCSAYFASQPPWVGEGLARFLETMKLDEEKHTAILGAPGPWIPMAGPDFRRSLPPLAPLLRNEGVNEDAAGDLVFFLINREGKRFDAYLKALFRGDAPDAAWSASFPQYVGDAGLARLQSDAGAYLSSGDYRIVIAPLAPFSGQVTSTRMPEPEIRAMRGRLFLLADFGDDEAHAKAQQEADAALQADPTLVDAMELRVQLAEGVAARMNAAANASGLRPDEARAWMLVDEALGDEAGSADQEALRQRSLEKAVALAPDNARALSRLARAMAIAGEAAQAGPLVLRSLELMPNNADALDTFALVADKQGLCDAVLRFQRMAVERLPRPQMQQATQPATETPALRHWREMTERLHEYELRCGPARSSQPADAQGP